MVIVLFGESCTGKSAVAELLKENNGAKVYSGKDYMRLAKSEAEAKKIFSERLKSAQGVIVYVTAELEQLALVPQGAFRVLFTAEIATIKERFSRRMNGNLPAPVASMLEKKHGMFDAVPYDFHAVSEASTPEDLYAEIAKACGLL